MTKLIQLVVLIGCIHGPLLLAAQSDWKSSTPEQLLILAREQSFHGDREKAREMLRFILSQTPDNHDVRILLGRTYAWDGQSAEARTELLYVLSHAPNHMDALNALIDLEIWNKRYDEALRLANRSLLVDATSEELLFKRASILHQQGKEDETVASLKQLLAINASHEQGLALLKSIKMANRKYTASISCGIDIFSKIFDPAHYSAVEIGRRNGWGSSLVRVNYTNRFEMHGLQTEIDLYPTITRGIYAYLNYAYSQTNLFPEHKAGAEFYFRLPHSLEVSGGARHLLFAEVPRVTIYTASLGWYFKEYWISARVFVTPEEAGAGPVAPSVLLRKYFESSDDFLNLSAGIGFSPDEKGLQSGSGFTTDGLYNLESRRIGLMWSKSFPNDYILNFQVNITYQELGLNPLDDVVITNAVAMLKKRL